jgi:hypothetical protein
MRAILKTVQNKIIFVWNFFRQFIAISFEIAKHSFAKYLELFWGIYVLYKLFGFSHGDFYEAYSWFNTSNWDKLVNFFACYAVLFPLPSLVWKYILGRLMQDAQG